MRSGNAPGGKTKGVSAEGDKAHSTAIGTFEGCPDTYTPEHARLAKGMRERGATDAEITEVFRISRATFLLWQATHADFSEACAVDQLARQRRAEDKIYEVSIGHDRVEQRVVVERGNYKVITVKTHMAPNVEALKFLLANGDPKKWHLKPEPAVDPPKEDSLAQLLREIQGTRIMPKALIPGEEKCGAVIAYTIPEDGSEGSGG